MSAAVAEDRQMTIELSVAKLQSDGAHIQSDFRDLKADLKDVRSDLGSFKSEFYAFKSEFHSFKFEVAREFGAVKASIETVGTQIEKAKLWTILTAVGTILSMLSSVVVVVRVLKL